MKYNPNSHFVHIHSSIKGCPGYRFRIRENLYKELAGTVPWHLVVSDIFLRYCNQSLLPAMLLIGIGVIVVSSYYETTSAENYSLVAKWGQFGSGEGKFNLSSNFYCPNGLALDPSSSEVYVVDSLFNDIKKFTANGSLIKKWDSVTNETSTSFGAVLTKKCSSNLYEHDDSLSIDAMRNVYLADIVSNSIQKYDFDGNLLVKWNVTPSSSKGAFVPVDQYSLHIQSIALDPVSADVYVLTTYDVQKYNHNGTLIQKWDVKPGGVRDIYVDPVSNIVYILSAYDVQKYDHNGTFIAKWGSKGVGDDQFAEPAAITIDKYGYVYVSDSAKDSIQKFTNNGTLVNKWGSNCKIVELEGCLDPDKSGPLSLGDGQFSQPVDVAIDQANRLYVLERGNNRVQVFASSLPPDLMAQAALRDNGPKMTAITSVPENNSQNKLIDNFQLYEDSENYFEIQYPKDWNYTKEISAFTDKLHGVELAPVKESIATIKPTLKVYRINPYLWGNDTLASLDQLTNNTILEAVQQRAPYSVTDIVLDGNPANMVNTRYSNSNFTTILTIKNDKAYSLTYSADYDNYASYLTVINKMINSFHRTG